MGFPSGIGPRCLVVLMLLLPAAARAGTPGEVRNLSVTGYDPATGKISLSYDPACGAADHHIEYGPLQDVRTYGYSEQVCGIGTSGVYDQFNPGSGSYFFLLVGDDGVSIEGSYGFSSINGVRSERPQNTLDPSCSFVQDLSQTCDVVRVDVNEAIGVADGVLVLQPVLIDVAEAIGVTDGTQVLQPVLIAVTENIVVTDAPAPTPSLFVSVAEAIAVSDAPAVRPPVLVDVTETIGVTDAPTPTPYLLVSVAETIRVSDAPAVRPPVLIDVAEAIGVTDGTQALLPILIAVTETIGVTDSPALTPSLFVSVAETIGVSDAPAVRPPALVEVTEAIGVADAPAPTPSLFVSVAEAIGVSDAPAVRPPALVEVTEAIGVTDGLLVLQPVVITVTENIVVTDTPTPTPSLFVSVGEVIGVHDAPGVRPPALVDVAEAIGVTDGTQVLQPVLIAVTEAIGVADGLLVLQPVVITVTEGIVVTDAPAPQPSIFVSVGEIVAVGDAPGVHPPVMVAVTEAIGVADDQQVRPPALIDVTEMIGVADTPTGEAMQSLAHFGAAVSAAGDLNQDGIGDWLVGAPSHRAPGGPAEAGTVTVHFGSADPAERMKADLVFEGAGAHDRAGVAVAGNFDFNADGIPDILIGAEQFNRTPDHDHGAGCEAGAPCGAGRVYLIYFDPGNPVFSSSPLSLADVGGTIPGVVFEGAAPGDQTGFAVAAGGRIDPGGGQDILIGAPGRDAHGRTDAGTVYAIFDAAALGGRVSLERVACTRGPEPCPAGDEIAGVVYEGAAAGDSLGFSIAFVGDVVQNPGAGPFRTSVDIGMGAPGSDEGGDAAGMVYVVDTGRGLGTDRVEVNGIGVTTPGIRMRGTQIGEQLGWAIRSGGDSRADGLPDMLIGAPFHDVDALIDAGRVIHISGAFTTGIYPADDVGGTIGGVIWLGAAAQDGLGRALDGVGDVTGDGFDDVVLGAPFTDPVIDAGVLSEAGSIYLIAGRPAGGGAGRVSVSEVGVSVAGRELVGSEAGEHVGSSIANTGDIDGDGDDDFIVGAPDRDLSNGAPDVGGVYLVLEGEPEQVSRSGPGRDASSGARGGLIRDATVRLGQDPGSRMAARLGETLPKDSWVCLHAVAIWCREGNL